MNTALQESKPDHNKPAVEAKGLRKSFGEQKVLQEVDLAVAPGEIVTVLGQSGTGKSVLLKLLIGLEKPDDGSIVIQEKDITKLPLDGLNEVRKRIGFLFQQAALYDSMTIEQNVTFPLRRHMKTEPAEERKRAAELITSMGMDPGRDLAKMPSEISGGMKKRVGLARALVLDPEIVMFDEPTAGLDPITASEIDELIIRLRDERKIACIVVTHDIHCARLISDRVIVLREGAVVAEGSFREVQASRDPFIRKFLMEDS